MPKYNKSKNRKTKKYLKNKSRKTKSRKQYNKVLKGGDPLNFDISNASSIEDLNNKIKIDNNNERFNINFTYKLIDNNVIDNNGIDNIKSINISDVNKEELTKFVEVICETLNITNENISYYAFVITMNKIY